MTEEEPGLRAELREGCWRLAGAAERELINGYLGYLADRGFSVHTVRAYAFGLTVADVDIPRGWVRVMGKGGKERRVPLDPDVAGLIQAYLLAGRPETSNRALFVVARGPHRGQPLTAPGCARSSAITGAGPGCRPGTRTRCGTPSAPPWPRPG